jgi:copper resistance protein D
VTWLLRDFDLFGLVLRALSLSLEALTAGGVLFLLFVATPSRMELLERATLRKFTSWFALALGLAQALAVAISCATLMNGGLGLHDVASANFFRADCVLIAAGFGMFCLLRFANRSIVPALIVALIAVGASVLLSHAASQLDHRDVLLVLTAAHHLGAAAWIGAMPALLIAMRASESASKAHALAATFSKMAIAGVALIILAGVGMSCFYVGSWQGLYGTSYGVLLIAKVYIFLLALLLGASNYFLVRRTRSDAAPVLTRLRRFSEVEIGLTFIAIVAAASMTSQSPASDLTSQLVTGHAIAERVQWKWPTLHTPGFAQLTPRTSMKVALQRAAFSGGSDNDAEEAAWSEYNHHWAGLIVLAAGLLALLARFRGQRWAGNWPLLFLALALFIVIRGDPETWPLGPWPFWGSFAEPEVLEHRLFAALIAAFAVFEWAVETGKVRWRWAALIFPAMCAAGGALLLIHMHNFGQDTQNAMLVGLSHTGIAVLGITAGWSRWLQLRSTDPKYSRISGWAWPVCFVLVGVVLLDYREAAAVQAYSAAPPP